LSAIFAFLRLLPLTMLCSDAVTVRRKKRLMPPDTAKSSQQATPLNALAVRDNLRHLYGLVGLRTNVEVATLGTNQVIAFSPMWVEDADKLARVLAGAPELRPYLVGRPPVSVRGEVMDPANCVHLGVCTGLTCPHCGHVVGEPSPAPQVAT
jgi:hypothetical protein